MSGAEGSELIAQIEAAFRERIGVTVQDIRVRTYPDEVNYLVFVAEEDLHESVKLGNQLDEELAQLGVQTFVIVRKASKELSVATGKGRVKSGVRDSRATDLIRLISARSRVSTSQPSLAYVRDAQSNLSAVTAARHHLVFGRRGAGKTALLVEARRQLTAERAVTAWVNIQTLRHEPTPKVVLYVMDELLTAILGRQKLVRPESVVSVDASRLAEDVSRLISATTVSEVEVTSLVPRVQRTLSRFLEIEGFRVYLFLDDFYYLARSDQPLVLDLLHGCVRDCDAWLKVASIRHLTRWFQSSPPLGLQTIHDAELIDLDVTLQNPSRAKQFLENVLMQYARRIGVTSLTQIFGAGSLDRLVLASGAVPRDYLVLASSAITKAQARPTARLVGVQDVNQAAGDAAGAKLQEMEDDMASNVGTTDRTLNALKVVRNFCLEEQSYSYFLVDYRDKEDNPASYSLLTDLMDVRLIHLVDQGVSDAHRAGRRFEAFMLDLSQFSGSRLRQRLHVIDFVGGLLVAKQTRGKEPAKVGRTPLQVISILRGAPTFSLDVLNGAASGAD